MRLRHPDGTVVHLAYCTNVHQAEDLEGVLALLERHAEPVRDALGADRLGLGLWLSRDIASTLLEDPGALARLRRALDARALEVVTLNGFPYGRFHAPTVKRDVYVPDWASHLRASYTLELARLLVRLLPDDAARGSISTLPLGWRSFGDWRRWELARRLLEQLAGELERLAAESGRPIRVGFEPEPGCVIETTEQAQQRLSDLNPEWFGVCLDACHLAVQFEEPVDALGRLGSLPVVKAQVACALRVRDPADQASIQALRRFDEPRFLHQVRTCAGGQVVGADDLDEALAGKLPDHDEWRVHFHVPVHDIAVPPLDSTRAELEATLQALLGGQVAATDHLEVETYTWSVLPDAVRPRDDAGLIEGFARELAWTRDRLLAVGLEEE